MKKFKYIIGLLSIVSIAFVSCEKEFDGPTITEIPTGNVITIAELRAMHAPGSTIEITNELSIQGVIVADESTGNLYKESYIEDATGGINLRFISSTGLYIGDSVRVYLKGSKLLRYNQMMQVDSLHPDNNITKIATLKNRTPQIVSINDILNNLEDYQGELIQIDTVYFIEGGQGKMYADAENLESVSRFLQDINGNQIDVRTSGYANFASDTIPAGAGTFIGIMAQYNNGAQLLVRNPNELKMDGGIPILKNFDDNSLTSGGWSQQNVVGNVNWTVDSQGSNGSPYGVIKNYIAPSNYACETWLVSPSIDFSTSISPSMTLRSDVRYTGAALEVYVTTNYTGDVTTSTWSPLAVTLDTDDSAWGFVPSGLVDLSSYINPNVRIAFKYTGTNSDGSTWELDDITIIK
jgi:hypothetical protein